MDKSIQNAVTGAVLRTYDSWSKLKPTKNAETKNKVTSGKGLTIERITNTATASMRIIVTHSMGKIDVSFINVPGGKYIDLRIGNFQESFHDRRITIAKGTRKDTVIGLIKEQLNLAYDKYPKANNFYGI